MKSKTAALVLSGGGSLGAAHIGAIKSLTSKGYVFDFAAGVSAGAIVGALVALGKKPDEIEKIVLGMNLFSLAFDFSPGHFGFLRGNKIKKLLDEVFEEREFEDLDIPLYIGTTDFETGERIVINKGKVADAVRASISVPILFEPFFHESEQKWLVDGGLTQNFPLDVAIEKYSGQKIFAVDVAALSKPNLTEPKKIFGKIRNIQKISEHTFRIFFKNQQKNFPVDSRVVKIIPDLADFKTIDVLKLKEIFKKGEMAVENIISL